MNFDWTVFCQEHGIEYVETGPNVARGNINIRCPFCSDHSHHMGLKLEVTHPYWGCWRCGTSGAHPLYLLRHLVGDKTARSAVRAAEEGLNAKSKVDEFDQLLREATSTAQPAPLKPKVMPKEFMTLYKAAHLRAGSPFVQYMHERGISMEEDEAAFKILATYANLKVAFSGPYANRIILPVFHEGELVSWVGRTIKNEVTPRYLTEPSGDLKMTVAGHDNVMALPAPVRRMLVIVEGPFDYLKMIHLSRTDMTRSFQFVATFGTEVTEPQKMVLAKIIRRYKGTIVLFDREAHMQGRMLAQELQEYARSGKVEALPVVGRKDPGDMTLSDFATFRSMALGLSEGPWK